MTYEEKYKRAFEIAKEVYHDDRKDKIWREWLTKLFPELKESEDEKMRKMCIRYLDREYQHHSSADDRKNLEKCITWLEKQGFGKEQTNLPCFTFDDVLALECCMETVKKVQEDEELYGKLNDLHSKVYDAYQLEKQGEMKSTEDTKKLDADKVIA